MISRAIAAFQLTLVPCLLAGCAHQRSDSPGGEVSERVMREWKEYGSYYALLEIVDAYIDPKAMNHATKADVMKYLGRGLDNEDEYPNAGPKMWVYPSSRRVPYGHYLVVEFDENDCVKEIVWLDE